MSVLYTKATVDWLIDQFTNCESFLRSSHWLIDWLIRIFISGSTVDWLIEWFEFSSQVQRLIDWLTGIGWNVTILDKTYPVTGIDAVRIGVSFTVALQKIRHISLHASGLSTKNQRNDILSLHGSKIKVILVKLIIQEQPGRFVDWRRWPCRGSRRASADTRPKR